MALSDKNILITPNRSQTADPKIEFVGASSTLGPQTITLRVYPTSSGTISLEGSAGQLFSVTNTLTGTIYSVNDVSGIPSIEVLDTGLVKFAQYSGNVLVGTGIDDGSKLQVRGNLRAGVNGWNSSPASTTFPHTLAATTGSSRVVNFDGNGNSTPSVWWTNGSRALGAIDAQDPGLTFWANNGSSWQKQISLGYGTVNIETVLQQGGNQVLHAGNYSSYALPLSGGTVTGNTRINQLGVGSSNNANFDFYNNGSSYFNGSVTIDDNLTITPTSNQSLSVQHNGTGTAWFGRIVSRNSSMDKAAFLGTYGGVAGVFAHNDALGAWAPLYINTIDSGAANGTGQAVIFSRLQLDADGTDSWYRAGSGNRHRFTTTGGADFIIGNGSGVVTINGNQVLHANNYSSYALPLGGGNLTGRLTVSVNGRGTSYTQSNIEVYTTDNTPPGLSFHRGGYSATLLYENDGELYTNPWTTRGQTGKLLAAGNYNNYAPTLTGGGASGTWSISITGSAASASNAGYANSAGSAASVAASAITGQVGMWTSAARPGPYRLYRREDDTNYSVQTHWTGSYWRLYGYSGDSAHADTHVGYADSAGTVTNISSSQVAPIVIYTTPSDASGYIWIRFNYANGNTFNSGQHQIEFYVTRSINENSNSPYGGCTAKFTAQAREWHSGQEMMVVQYGEHGANASFGQGFYISNARIADLAGGGNWVYLRVRAGITYYFREALHGGTGCDFSTLQGTTDPGSTQPIFAGFNLISTSGDVNFYDNGNAVLHAGNYTSYSPTLTGGGASGTWGINITGTASDPSKVPLTGGTMTGTLFINSKLRVNTASGPSDNAYGTATDIPMYMFGSTRTQSTFLIENNVNSSIDYPVIVIRRTLTPVGSRFGGMIRFADKNSSGTEISSQIYSFNRLTSQDLFLDAGSGTNDRVVLRAGSSSSMQVAETFIMNVKAVIYTYSGSTSSLDIDCREGNYFTRTISSNSTFTFSNVPAASGFNVAYSFTLELTHTSGTVTWPASVKWPGNTAPSLTTGKTHLFMFVTDDAGSRWRGSYLTNYDN